MFKKTFCMDLKRCFCSLRFLTLVLVSTLLMVGTAGNYIFLYLTAMSPQEKQTLVGAVDFLNYAMGFDVFKVVIVLLLSGLYTSSFCQDENNHYLRMLLNRTDSIVYARSKFLTNALAVLSGALLVCFLFVLLVVCLGYPVISKDASGSFLGVLYYKTAAKEFPLLYVGMCGLQFGMVAAACSSVGLLFSIYETNGFASIGVSGILFFAMLSFSMTLLNGTPFDILNLVGMHSVLPAGSEVSPWLMFAWGMLYPLVVIVFCCVMFERRMEWRAENGII